MGSKREKVTFPSTQGKMLSGALEWPEEKPRGFALFAHCFSCGKDVPAASRISRSLAERGFAVLRFDFTGLGGSEGDFSNSNFSTNLQDLLAAADFLRQEYQAPTLLIGHSLGGAAVLAAAAEVPEARGVVTIGAPSDPEHVTHLLKDKRSTIEEKGEAEIQLGPRSFKIRKQFLDDIEKHRLKAAIAGLGKALLIFHAPRDEIVGIDEARRIYEAAQHPKSFISLDDADHLLSAPADARYVAHTIAAWAERYLAESKPGDREEPRPRLTRGEVQVDEKDRAFLRKVSTDDHQWLADEPEAAGGENRGPDPYELLLAALGTCTSMTLRLYANRKGWPLDDVSVRLKHSREHSEDCANCEEASQQIDVMERQITLRGNLDETQRQRLMEIAQKCPVHKTLLNDIEIRDQLAQRQKQP